MKKMKVANLLLPVLMLVSACTPVPPVASPSTSPNPISTPVSSPVTTDPTNSPSDPGQPTIVEGTEQLLDIKDNLARLPGVILNVSSEYSDSWKKESLIDGKLNTSWFTAVNDEKNPSRKNYFELVFPQSVNTSGINFKGNREYENGYDVISGILTVNSTSGSFTYNISFPKSNKDFNIVFNQSINSVNSIKFEITEDVSGPGLSEFEVVAAK